MNNTKPFFYNRLFIASHVLLFGGLLLWFNPLTQPFFQKIDHSVFQILNSSLLNEPEWQAFWGMLNHRRETKLNLLIAALFNVWAIFATQDKKLRYTRLKQILYFWICFEIGFILQEGIFNNWLHILRDSPSLVLQPAVKLTSALQDSNLKEGTQHSFPSGHAFSLIYWASFTLLCSPKRVGLMGLIFAVLFCLPRLFIGAHWLSDEIFSMLLALAWLSWTVSTPIYKKIISVQTFRYNFKDVA